jgi:hypothetical protein
MMQQGMCRRKKELMGTHVRELDSDFQKKKLHGKWDTPSLFLQSQVQTIPSSKIHLEISP